MPSPRYRFSRALRRVLFLTILLSGLSLALSGVLRAQANAPRAAAHAQAMQPTESWMGIYMGARKIGYISVQVEPTTYQAHPALRSVTNAVTKLAVLGTTVEQRQSEVTVSDLQYNPLAQTFDIHSNGSALHVDAAYDYAAHKVVCHVGTGSAATPKTLTIPAGAILSGDTNFLLEGKKLSAGQQVSIYSLNPISVELQESKVEIGGQETIRDTSSGKSVAVRLVTAQTPMGEARSWETPDGDVIKGEMTLGGIRLLMLKEPKATAQNLNSVPPAESEPAGQNAKTYAPPADFAVITAIQTDKPIEKPRQLRALHVTIEGVPDRRMVLSDLRQKAEIQPTANPAAGYTVDVEIDADAFDATKSAELPVTDPAFAPYLEKAAYLDTDDAHIRQTAQRLRGQDENAYRVACRIRDWVHKVMTPDASIGVPRSATDIFARRRGVCRDYATLYTAVARAAGIPTRLCGGIVYSEGKFFYHAWAESYVGRWIAFDPTLYDPEHPVDFVDATHIKFAQGDVTSMFNVVNVVGKLRILVRNASS